jgi:hypothetical protein
VPRTTAKHRNNNDYPGSGKIKCLRCKKPLRDHELDDYCGEPEVKGHLKRVIALGVNSGRPRRRYRRD